MIKKSKNENQNENQSKKSSFFFFVEDLQEKVLFFWFHKIKIVLSHAF